jgi:streptogramin lyase
MSLLATVVAALAYSTAQAITVNMIGGGITDPYQLVPKPDGGFIVTDYQGIDLPGQAIPSMYPVYLVTPDGNTWIGVDIPSAPVMGPVTVGPLPSGGWPGSLAYGADHMVWFTERLNEGSRWAPADVVGRINPATGAVTEFPVSPGAEPETIIAGPDGALWFIETGAQAIGRITTSGAVSEFPLPAGVQTERSTGRELTFGPGDDLYVTVGNGLARMSRSGAFKGIVTGGLSDFHPESVAYGADGNLWTVECGANDVARVSPEGVVTRTAPGTFPERACLRGATRMADGSIWLYEFNTERVGHVIFDSPLVTTDDPSDVQPTATDINGTAAPRGARTTAHFQYGATASYGSVTPDQDVGDDDPSVPVTARLTGLQPSTTYHFRTVATSVIGTVYGDDETVTTPALPPPPPPPPPVDRDGDGYSAAVDCDDLSAAIHPGAFDRPGDRIDQDCSGADAAYQRFQPHADAGWKTVRGRIVFTRMLIDAMPAGSSLTLDCTGTGCKAKAYTATLAKPVRKLDVTRRLKGARLGKGAVVQLTLSRKGYITTIVRWTIGPPPRITILCQPPGARKPGAC